MQQFWFSTYQAVLWYPRHEYCYKRCIIALSINLTWITAQICYYIEILSVLTHLLLSYFTGWSVNRQSGRVKGFTTKAGGCNTKNSCLKFLRDNIMVKVHKLLLVHACLNKTRMYILISVLLTLLFILRYIILYYSYL